MAKDKFDLNDAMIAETEASVKAEAKAGGPAVPFVEPVRQNAPPTEAQHKWLRENPTYIRISHSVMGRFKQRGTLTSDGSFIPESKLPVHDGGGSFGVGIRA